jgi:hypothetical protein
MCIIMTEKTTDAPIHKSWFADFVSRNSDGSGIMVTGGDCVYTEKLLSDDPEATYQMYLRGRERGGALAFHARFRTHGAVSTDNLHPYEVIPGQLYMMHNGVLSTGYGQPKPDHPTIARKMEELATRPVAVEEVSYQDGYGMYGGHMGGYTTHKGGYKPTPTDPATVAAQTLSDTWHYIEDFIKPLVLKDPSVINTHAFQALVAAHIGVGNKFVFVTPTNLIILNRSAGINTSQRWLSNTYAWSGNAGSNLFEEKRSFVPATTGGTGGFLSAGRVGTQSVSPLVPPNSASEARKLNAIVKSIARSGAAVLNKRAMAANEAFESFYAGFDDDWHIFYDVDAMRNQVIRKVAKAYTADGLMLMPAELKDLGDEILGLRIMGFNKNGQPIPARTAIPTGSKVPYLLGNTTTMQHPFDNPRSDDFCSHVHTFNRAAQDRFSRCARELWTSTTSSRDTQIRQMELSDAVFLLYTAFGSCPLYSSFAGLTSQVVGAMLAQYYDKVKVIGTENEAVTCVRLALAAYCGISDGSRPSPLLFGQLLEEVLDEAALLVGVWEADKPVTSTASATNVTPITTNEPSTDAWKHNAQLWTH